MGVESRRTQKTLTSYVAEVLREKIISHEIKSGQPLRQDALASELNVSRIPVREALMQLEVEGLVRFEAYKGAVATEVSAEEVEELFNLRVLLECDVLRSALDVITDEQLDQSNVILEEFDKLLLPDANRQTWGSLNWKFHRSLYLPSGKARTLDILSQLHTSSDRYLRLQIQLSADFSRAEQEHHDLLKFCRKRDKRASIKCVKEHILTTKDDLIRVIKTIG
ncbi:MAG: GntR family transcriptional regulator [Gammaproteobacteria bacterium]|nr:GntR family transcriptional regulator [Gammaproteobacteria bacterium]